MNFILFLLVFVILGSCKTESLSKIEGIKITEFMAKNDSALLVGEEYHDWLEISNTSMDTVDLDGWYLSDNKKKLTKARITNCTLLPNQSKIFYASGQDSILDHVGFKLRSSSGRILLSNSEEAILDEVKYSQQVADYSSVLLGEKWVITKELSPGENKEPIQFYKGITKPVEIRFAESEGSVTVELSSDQSGDIYYSIDGNSITSENQKLYKGAFALDTNKIVFAELRNEEYYNLHQSARAYVNTEIHTLPVFSLVTNPDNLWDPETGIYTEGNYKNYNKRTDEWIKSGIIEYQMDSLHEIVNVDYKIYGMGTRKRPKKSIACIGKGLIDNNFFDSNTKKKVDGFVLRACYSDNSRYKNEIVKAVNDIMGGKTLMQEYQPVVLYMNGEYWGVYNLFERKNKDFIEAHYGIEPEHVLNGSHSTVKTVKGSDESFKKFSSELDSMDLEGSETFAFLDEHLDLESYTDFWIHELYTNKADRFNNRYWKVESDTAKWRYISYDFDVGFADPTNKRTLKYYQDDRNKGIHNFGNLIKNPEYKMMYFERLCDFLNFGYRADVAEEILEEVDSLIAVEFKRDFERWEPVWEKSKDDAEHQKKHILKYVTARKDFLLDSIASHFGLTEKVKIFKDFEVGAKLIVNGYEVIDSVVYFAGMPLDIKVKLDSGFEFEGWQGSDEDIPEDGEFIFDEAVEVRARIVPD